MYSPKIDPLLVRPLYHLGRARKKPMTAIVNEMIFQALVAEELDEETSRHFDAAVFKYQPTTRKEAA